jgi:hypothetical protein
MTCDLVKNRVGKQVKFKTGGPVTEQWLKMYQARFGQLMFEEWCKKQNVNPKVIASIKEAKPAKNKPSVKVEEDEEDGQMPGKPTDKGEIDISGDKSAATKSEMLWKALRAVGVSLDLMSSMQSTMAKTLQDSAQLIREETKDLKTVLGELVPNEGNGHEEDENPNEDDTTAEIVMPTATDMKKKPEPELKGKTPFNLSLSGDTAKSFVKMLKMATKGGFRGENDFVGFKLFKGGMRIINTMNPDRVAMLSAQVPADKFELYEIDEPTGFGLPFEELFQAMKTLKEKDITGDLVIRRTKEDGKIGFGFPDAKSGRFGVQTFGDNGYKFSDELNDPPVGTPYVGWFKLTGDTFKSMMDTFDGDDPLRVNFIEAGGGVAAEVVSYRDDIYSVRHILQDDLLEVSPEIEALVDGRGELAKSGGAPHAYYSARHLNLITMLEADCWQFSIKTEYPLMGKGSANGILYTFWLAPRLDGGDKTPEENEKALCQVSTRKSGGDSLWQRDFDAKLKAEEAQKLIDTMLWSPSCSLRFTKEGLRIREMDMAKTSMVDALIPKSSFVDYPSKDANASIDMEPDGIRQLLKIMRRRLDNGGGLRIVREPFKGSESEYSLRLELIGQAKFSLFLKDDQEGGDLIPAPKVKFEGTCTLDMPGSLFYALKQFKDDDTVKLKLGKDQLIVGSGKKKVTIGKKGGASTKGKDVEVLMKMKLLEKLSSVLSGDTLEISIGKDSPLMIESDGVQFWAAPSVTEE